jgi:hypothetical protein
LREKSNRFYSKIQEKKLAKDIGLKRTPNSGATLFLKGDLHGPDILMEAKTLKTKQKQHTIKKEWFDKLHDEAFSTGKLLAVLAFDFGDGDNYIAMRASDWKMLYDAWRREREND